MPLSKKVRLLSLTLLLLSLAALILACKGGGGPGGAGSGGQISLQGAGATFPNPLYQKWLSEYGKANPNVRIDYQSIGSGGGIPSADIAVVHRSDGSGTTFVFTDYLSKISPEWKEKVGANKSPQWPV